MGVHRDPNSWSGSSLGIVRVHSLTLSYTFGNMKCDSWTSFLTRTFANPCLGRELKARVVTKCILCCTDPIHSWWFYCICVLIRVVWNMDKLPIYLCCWHVLKTWRLCVTKKIKDVEVCGGILQDHDVMYMSINHGKIINDFREHGRVAMKESLHKHRRGDEWTN